MKIYLIILVSLVIAIWVTVVALRTIKMSAEALLITGKRIAIISFFCWTFDFSLYYFTSSFPLLFLGYIFIGFFGAINICFLVSFIIRASTYKEDRKKMIQVCVLMFLNIPLLLVYCWFAIVLSNTMRVTFINKTRTELRDIKIIGCEPKEILTLKPGQHETIWIAITGDCSLNVAYVLNGQIKNESVAGYCSKDLGKKMIYRIGDNN